MLDTESTVCREKANILPLFHSSSTRKQIAQEWQGRESSGHLSLPTGSFSNRCDVLEPSPHSQSILGPFSVLICVPLSIF